MIARLRLACLSLLLAGCAGDVGAVLLPVPATREGEIGKGYFELGGVVQYLSYIVEDGKKISGDDVVLDEELPLNVALEAIEEQGDEAQRSASFLAAQDKNLWKSNKIPYRFDSRVSSVTRARVQQAMGNIADATGVEFRERGKESDYVEIEPFKDPNCSGGGHTHVGRGTGGRRVVSLSECSSYGTGLHELVHVLGGEHEHQRSDRDNYVKVNLENVIKEYVYCFEKLQGRNKKGPYTIDSIMHYGSTAFTKDYNKMTITTRDGKRVPYNRDYLTSNDAEAIFKMYPQGKPSLEYGGDWIMSTCSESQKDRCEYKRVCLANKHGAYQWKRDAARCPGPTAGAPGNGASSLGTNPPPPPSTTAPASGPPVIEAAGSCGDGSCIWIQGTDFGAHPYVDVRAVGSDAIIGSYHAPNLTVDPDHLKNGTWVLEITFSLKTPTETALFASQGLRVWVVNPDLGASVKWSNEVLVKR